MEVQAARHVSVPINTSGATVETAEDSGASASRMAAVKTIRSLKQLEFAEINGMKVMIGEEQLIQAIERAIREMTGPETALEVKIHESTRSVVMRVMNRETGELIREVPPERTLDIVYKMMEIAGLLFDERV